MTAEELDALEARLATIDDEVWTILGGNANVTMGHIKALRAAAPQLIASARALESLRGLVAEVRSHKVKPSHMGGEHSSYWCGADEMCEICEGKQAIGVAVLALFPEET